MNTGRGRQLVPILIVLLVTLARGEPAAGATKRSTGRRLTGTVALAGTVITGVVTPGGDCGHKYWLALGTADGKPSGAVGLEAIANGPDLGKYLNQKVHVTGHYELCTGIEITAPFLVVQQVQP